MVTLIGQGFSKKRSTGRILAILLLAALAPNILFATLWIMPYSPLGPRLTLTLWTTTNILIFTAIVAASLRRHFLTAESLTLRITIGPVPKYLKENPGSPLILTFILSLILAAATYSVNATLANDIVTNTFLLLIAGIILQVIALTRKGSQEREDR